MSAPAVSEAALTALQQLRLAREMVTRADRVAKESAIFREHLPEAMRAASEARNIAWDRWHAAVRRFYEEQRGQA